MIHFNENTTIVIQTISRYGYSQHAIEWSNDCFLQLKFWLEEHKIQAFSGDKALEWVEGECVQVRDKHFFRSTIQRLIDVYRTGTVMRIHLVFYSRILKPDFVEVRDVYLSSIEGEFSKRQLRNISDVCNRFLGFLYVNNIDSLSKISYSTMLLYYQDIVQVNRTPIIPADIVEGFMFYLAEQGICSYGLGWYMYYIRSGKDPYSVNFTHDHVCELSENST